MKLKNNIDKKNIVFIILVILISLFISFCLISLKEYIFSCLFIILIIFLLYLYVHNSYKLEKDYIIINYGFFKLKFKYQDIKKVNIINDKLYLKIKSYDFIINNKEINEFKKEIEKRVVKK